MTGSIHGQGPIEPPTSDQSKNAQQQETTSWRAQVGADGESKDRHITVPTLKSFYPQRILDQIAVAKSNPKITQFLKSKTVKTIMKQISSFGNKIEHALSKSHIQKTSTESKYPTEFKFIQKAIQENNSDALLFQFSKIREESEKDANVAISEMYKNANAEGRKFLSSVLAEHFLPVNPYDANPVNSANRAIIQVGKLGKEIEKSNPGLGKQFTEQITREILSRNEVSSALHGLFAEASSGNAAQKEDIADFLYTLKLECPGISVSELFSHIKAQDKGDDKQVTKYIKYVSDNLQNIPRGILVSEWFAMVDAAKDQKSSGGENTKVLLEEWDREFEIDHNAGKIIYSFNNPKTKTIERLEAPWIKPEE